MNKKQRKEFIQKTLNEYFPNPPIPLEHKDAFTLLIAVLLSAQSTDARVNMVTPFLFEKASTPQKMMHIDLTVIQDIIRPCGLSNVKAKAIKELSRMIVEEFQGQIPCTFKELESLPGVGHKTASVIMSHAFHFPAFPVDTHIFRCARRWGLSTGKNVREVEEDLKKIYPKKDWIRLHLQIIYFARKFCPARGHKVDSCPICCVLDK